MIGFGAIFSVSYLIMIGKYRKMIFAEKYELWTTLYKFGFTKPENEAELIDILNSLSSMGRKKSEMIYQTSSLRNLPVLPELRMSDYG
jgi:hypothetical protein